MNGIPIDPSLGQWVGIVVLLAMFALCLYAAWEMKVATLVDENEQPISDTPLADEALRAIRDRATEMLREDQ